MHHGPIHQALTKELNPGSLGQGLCTEKPGIGSNAEFHSRLIRTSFIQLSCSFVLNAKVGRYVTRTLVNFAKYV